MYKEKEIKFPFLYLFVGLREVWKKQTPTASGLPGSLLYCNTINDLHNSFYRSRLEAGRRYFIYIKSEIFCSLLWLSSE